MDNIDKDYKEDREREEYFREKVLNCKWFRYDWFKAGWINPLDRWDCQRRYSIKRTLMMEEDKAKGTKSYRFALKNNNFVGGEGKHFNSRYNYRYQRLNGDNDCSYYQRKWWKFWVKKL